MAGSSNTNLRHAVGLMSGTSLDGIDVAALATDGEHEVIAGPAETFPYPSGFRDRLRGVLGGTGPREEIAAVEAELTRLHADAVMRFRERFPQVAIELIGFHGHTILHRPEQRRTWQIGDGALLAQLTGIDVVGDFRSADVAAGGQGAPLAPLYHAALAAPLRKPLAVLNLGGVGNVTWIGDGPDEILAFDTGPGNALIDDWVRRHTGQTADFDGALALAGRGFGNACRAFSGASVLRASAAEIARPRRFPQCNAGGSFGRGRRRDLDRDDRRRGRRRRPAFSGAAARMAGLRRRPA